MQNGIIGKFHQIWKIEKIYKTLVICGGGGSGSGSAGGGGAPIIEPDWWELILAEEECLRGFFCVNDPNKGDPSRV